MPAPTLFTKINRDRILSRRDVEAMIAEGRTLVIYNNQVLNLDGWIDKHPGGKLPMLHMVGCDASCEIAAYHSDATLRKMTAYRIGRVQGRWTNFKPPIRGGTFRKLGQKGEENTEVVRKERHLSALDSGYSSAEDEFLTDKEKEKSRGTIHIKEVEGSPPRSPAIAIPLEKATLNLKLGPSAPTTRTRDDDIADAMQAEVDECLDIYPSPDAETQESINTKYVALHERVRAAGFYKCNYWNYGCESIRYITLFTLFLTGIKYEWYISAGLALGFFWHQVMFSAHDAGHRGITGKFVPDTLIGIFVADFCCGLSIGWWKSSHNVHHLVTNSPAHDPDVQNTPLFATCPSFFSDTKSTYYENFTFVWDKACETMIPYQKYTYYPIMAIARFNLYLLSWCHLLSPRSKQLGAASWTRPAELAAMCAYWYLFGYVLCLKTIPDWPTRVAFVLTSHMSAMILHVQITLSHWGMPTCDLGDDECFAQKQLRTTMDVLCPEWLDWFHGGLQFQAIHHLFPRVPRHNLRKLQPLVQEFCAETNIPYSIYGFAEGNAVVLGRLEVISNQLAMLGKCQDYMAVTGESALH